VTKVIVCHRGYGCDTGCCGHVVEVDGEQVGGFHFAHPYGETTEDLKTFAEGLVREAGCDPADIDWVQSVIVDD
jgi:hypothetical protein